MDTMKTITEKERLKHCCKNHIGCFYHFVGDIGDATGKHYCGATSKDGRMTYGQDATEIKALLHCPLKNW